MMPILHEMFRIGLGPEQPGNRIIDKKDIEVDSRKVRPFDSTRGMFYDEFEDEEV